MLLDCRDIQLRGKSLVSRRSVSLFRLVERSTAKRFRTKACKGGNPHVRTPVRSCRGSHATAARRNRPSSPSKVSPKNRRYLAPFPVPSAKRQHDAHGRDCTSPEAVLLDCRDIQLRGKSLVSRRSASLFRLVERSTAKRFRTKACKGGNPHVRTPVRSSGGSRATAAQRNCRTRI
jgi:hypothetical protein